MKAKKILITGGAGFIGSHIVDLIVASGAEVVVLDDLSSGRREHLDPAARLIECSVLNPRLRQIIQSERPQALVHLAAQISVRNSVRHPELDASVNLLGLIGLMEAAVAAKSVERVVFASSGGAIYGDDVALPARETSQARPCSPYGVAKLASEHYLHYYQSGFGIPTLALRLANVYGPRQDPHGEAGVVAIFARAMQRRERTTINGSGEQTRDFVHVRDVARAFVSALAAECTGIVNIGTGIETSINRLHELMSACFDNALPPAHGPAKEGEQARSALDASLARELLDFAPKTKLADGLRETIASMSHG